MKQPQIGLLLLLILVLVFSPPLVPKVKADLMQQLFGNFFGHIFGVENAANLTTTGLLGTVLQNGLRRRIWAMVGPGIISPETITTTTQRPPLPAASQVVQYQNNPITPPPTTTTTTTTTGSSYPAAAATAKGSSTAGAETPSLVPAAKSLLGSWWAS